jgi:hypothetical protein
VMAAKYNPLTRPPQSLIHQASPLILFRVYTYVFVLL